MSETNTIEYWQRRAINAEDQVSALREVTPAIARCLEYVLAVEQKQSAMSGRLDSIEKVVQKTVADLALKKVAIAEAVKNAGDAGKKKAAKATDA